MAEGTAENTDWDRQHEDYVGNVFSVTQDAALRAQIVSKMPVDVRRVLIPGCGSVVELQKEILQARPAVREIVCTDVSSVAITAARGQVSDSRILFEVVSTSDMPFEDESFDCVVVVNSILSASDDRNRAMVAECVRVLRTGGVFCSLFPTVLATFEISHLDPRFAHWRGDASNTDFHVDLASSSFYEAKQSMRQIFYTPLRLRRIFRETGLDQIEMQVAFFDGKHFVAHGGTNEYYGLPVADDDLVIYELLVHGVKK